MGRDSRRETRCRQLTKEGLRLEGGKWGTRRRRGIRTGEEEVTEVGNGLGILEKVVVEDACGGGESGEVNEGREGACLRHRRKAR